MGGQDDTIIPSGNAIVFAASDFNCIAALDRRSGNLLWESARTPIEGEPESEYVLGISEGIVCVAGGKVVRAYKLDGGRLLWEHILEEQSYGRGMLSKSGIYIPMQDSIARLSVADGELLETIDVEAREGGLARSGTSTRMASGSTRSGSGSWTPCASARRANHFQNRRPDRGLRRRIPSTI